MGVSKGMNLSEGDRIYLPVGPELPNINEHAGEWVNVREEAQGWRRVDNRNEEVHRPDEEPTDTLSGAYPIHVLTVGGLRPIFGTLGMLGGTRRRFLGDEERVECRR